MGRSGRSHPDAFSMYRQERNISIMNKIVEPRRLAGERPFHAVSKAIFSPILPVPDPNNKSLPGFVDQQPSLSVKNTLILCENDVIPPCEICQNQNFYSLNYLKKGC